MNDTSTTETPNNVEAVETVPLEARFGGVTRKGVPNKATANAREAIARFVDKNSRKLQRWLTKIEQEQGAYAAYRCYLDLIEYHVPKLSRAIVTGADDGPVEVRVSWQVPPNNNEVRVVQGQSGLPNGAASLKWIPGVGATPGSYQLLDAEGRIIPQPAKTEDGDPNI